MSGAHADAGARTADCGTCESLKPLWVVRRAGRTTHRDSAVSGNSPPARLISLHDGTPFEPRDEGAADSLPGGTH